MPEINILYLISYILPTKNVFDHMKLKKTLCDNKFLVPMSY